MIRILLIILLLTLSPLAQAFEFKVHQRSEVMTEAEVTALINRVAAGLEHGIPHKPQLRVVVVSQVGLHKQTGKYTYFHRVAMTKVFQGGPPYPYRGWLPIKSVERYGIASKKQVIKELERAATEFFKAFVGVDPEKTSP